MLVGPIGRYTTGLFWSRGLGHVPGSVWRRHRGVFRYGHVFHQEVYRWCSSDQNNPYLPPNQKPWINSDVRSALSARTSAFKSGNTDDRKPVTISGDPSKQPNEHIKTKLKNTSTTITQEALGRASTTSQALKGTNQLLWTLPPLFRTSSTPFYARFEADNTAHTESACRRRGQSTHRFCRGRNPDPWSRWYTRPCAQSMRFPASWGFYRHFQSVPLSVCGSLVLQKIHHCAHTKEKFNHML